MCPVLEPNVKILFAVTSIVLTLILLGTKLLEILTQFLTRYPQTDLFGLKYTEVARTWDSLCFKENLFEDSLEIITTAKIISSFHWSPRNLQFFTESHSHAESTCVVRFRNYGHRSV